MARDAASEWLDPEGERRRELRRWIVASALGHGLALAALAWAPAPRTAPLPGVVTVDLVAMAPAAAPMARAARAPAPAPAPKPEPRRPEPPRPEPPRREAVLPKTPEKAPEPKKPKAQPEPDPKPKPEPRSEPRQAQPKLAPPKAKPAPPKKQEEYDDLLAQLRAERGEARPEKVDRATAWRAQASAVGAAGGAAGQPADAEVAAWLRAAKIHVEQAWVLPPGFQREALLAAVRVRLDAGGRVLAEPRIARRSGNPWYDESVVRAIQKASPLPAPPEAGEWEFEFRPPGGG